MIGKTPRLIDTVPALVLLIHQIPQCLGYRSRDQSSSSVNDSALLVVVFVKELDPEAHVSSTSPQHHLFAHLVALSLYVFTEDHSPDVTSTSFCYLIVNF